MAGHQGRNKTLHGADLTEIVLAVGISGYRELYSKICICQKASKQRVKAAPLISIPVISEPFSREAMDIVGPLPRSKDIAIY